MANVQAVIKTAHYKTVLSNQRHEIIADEPLEADGTDLGFSPSELLCSALAAAPASHCGCMRTEKVGLWKK